MIRVNLNVLLAERGLTATKVSENTGISKTTLSSLVNNTGKGIQYDTLDTLCNYLNVTPADFFDYIPLDYSLSFSLDEVNIVTRVGNDEGSSVINAVYNFRFYIDVTADQQKKTYELTGKLIPQGINHIKDRYNYHILLEFANDEVEDFKSIFYNKLSAAHQSAFNKKVKDEIWKNFYRDVSKNAVSYDYDDNLTLTDREAEVTSSVIFLNITNINVVTDWNYSFQI